MADKITEYGLSKDVRDKLNHMGNYVISTDTLGAAKKDHTHPISEVTNLTQELANKSDKTHTHSINEVTNLQKELDNLSTKIDEKVADAQSDFAEFKKSADGTYLQKKSLTIKIAGDINKFYPVYLPLVSNGLSKITIWRSVNTDAQWRGGLILQLMAVTPNWGSAPPVAFIDVLKLSYNSNATPSAILKDGFLGNIKNPNEISSGIFLLLRGDCSYSIENDRLGYGAAQQFTSSVTSRDELVNGSVKILMAGCNITDSGATLSVQPETERNTTVVTSINYIRGM